MELWHAILLGIVEGITEFLPISSTGHLLLVSQIAQIPETDFTKSFEIIIQLGAILAVVALYPRRLLLEKPVLMRVIAGFIPTGMLGLLFYKAIKHYLLGNMWVVIGSLFIGGIAIILFERYFKAGGEKRIEDLRYREAALIGLVQCLSFVPGVSRSAATIFGGMWSGLSRPAAVEFSFLLAVPTMAAATGLDLLKNYKLILSSGNAIVLAVGFVVSFLVALGSIKFLLRFVSHNNFILFGVYRIIVAIAFFVVFF